MAASMRKGLALLAFFAAFCVLALPSPAKAACDSGSCPNCLEDDIATEITKQVFNTNANDTIRDINTQFDDLKTNFWIGYFWDEHVLDGMQNMAQTLATAAMMQMGEIGGFLDASEQLQRQRLMQQKAAEAHKDYQSSMEMCAIGTIAKGIGAAYRNGEFTAITMTKRSIERQLHGANVVATSGNGDDLEGRLQMFKTRFCDISDNNNGLAKMCTTSAPAVTADKDINFTRTILQPAALNVNFSDSTLTPDEQDVIALSNNLFANELLPPIPPSLLLSVGNQDIALDYRAVVAKRSVAENSFNAIVGLKSADYSVNNPGTFMNAVMNQLGVPAADQPVVSGKPPSYDSEMDFITKRVEQDPVFYTNLYDTPANLARKGAALRAINLIQHMDMFKSRIRNEAILAEIVELDVVTLQKHVQDAMDRMRKTDVK
jgi:hypothetical protein